MQGLLFARILTIDRPAPARSPGSDMIRMSAVELTALHTTRGVRMKETIWRIEWIVPPDRSDRLAGFLRKGMFCLFNGEVVIGKIVRFVVNGYSRNTITILGRKTDYVLLPLLALDALERGGRIDYMASDHALSTTATSNTALEQLHYASATEAHMKEDAR